MLVIRLSRIGKKKKPTYRIIISEKSKDTHGDFLEDLGHYDPGTDICEIKKDRILYWLSQGAQTSPTVHNLLVDQKVIDKPKVKASKAKKKKKKEKPAEAAKLEKTEEKKEEKKPIRQAQGEQEEAEGVEKAEKKKGG